MSDQNEEGAGSALALQSSKELQRGDGMDECVRFAQFMAKAKAVLPKHFHDAPGECLAIVMLSRDWKMNPYSVAMKTSIINNRLMFEGQLVAAVINNCNALEQRLRYTFDGEGKARTVTAHGQIRGEREERSITTGVPAAGQASNSPLWKGTPEDVDQQLTYKAARIWARRYIPEIMLGVYTPEDDWKDATDQRTMSGHDNAVSRRIGLLETTTGAGTGIPEEGKDEFIDQPVYGRGPAMATIEPMKEAIASVMETAALPMTEDQKRDFKERWNKPETGRQITDNPEDRQPEEDPLEEPIPDFGAVSCETCGGSGVVEDAESKGPCPKCSGQ